MATPLRDEDSSGTRRGFLARVPGGAATVWLTLLGIALVVSLAYGLGQARANRLDAIRLEMERQRAFEQLVARAQTIEVLLAKGLVTSPGCAGSLVFTDLWHQGLAAQEDLSELPLAHASLANSTRFMTQVADFGRYLVRMCAVGETISEADWETLAEMHRAAGELSLQLNELSGMIATGAFRWRAVSAATTAAGDEAVRQVRNRFGDIAEHMQEMPTLIYDGPFSDHILVREPKGLPAGEVTAEQAMEVARRFAPRYLADGGGAGEYQAVELGEIAGRIPAYAFALYPAGAGASPGAPAQGSVQPEHRGGGPEIRIDVTKQGGQVAWLLVQGIDGVDGGPPAPAVGSRTAWELPAQAPGQVPWPEPEQQTPPGEEAPDAGPNQAPPAPAPARPDPGAAEGGLSLAGAIARGQQFLAERGFANLTATYATQDDGVAICQYVGVQDGVLIYQDQISLKVRLGDGQILGYDGLDWLMSHTNRQLPAPTLSAADARAKLNPRLTVAGTRLALIPTPGLDEVLCHEFHCRLGDEDYLVYINAATGEEEAIFKLIDQGDGGQLVM